MSEPNNDAKAPRLAGLGAVGNNNSCHLHFSTFEIIHGLPPSQETPSLAALTIENQVWGNEPSREAITNRLQKLYLGSRYLARLRPGARRNAYTENLQAAIQLAQGLELYPGETLQLLRLEFNPRFKAPLSDSSLWNLILSRSRPGTSHSSPLKYATLV